MRKEAIILFSLFLTFILTFFPVLSTDIGVNVTGTTSSTTTSTTTTTLPPTTTTLPAPSPAKMISGTIPFVIGLGGFVKIAMFAFGGSTPEEKIRELILAIVIIFVSVAFIGAMVVL